MNRRKEFELVETDGIGYGIHVEIPADYGGVELGYGGVRRLLLLRIEKGNTL
jgi:hypothetical protein